MDTEKTVVIFRKWKDNGDIIALFPEVSSGKRNLCLCYEFNGQHGEADPDAVVEQTVPATPEEYAELKAYLEQDRPEGGYVFIVRHRVSNRMRENLLNAGRY